MDIFKTLIRFRIIPLLKKWHLLNIILGAIDILAIALAFQLAWFLNYYPIGGLFIFDRSALTLFLGILPVWLLTLYLLKATEIPRTKRYRVLLFEYIQSAVIILILLIIIYFVFRLYTVSRRFMVEIAFFGFLFLFFTRMLEYKLFRNFRARGYNQINVVLIGDDSAAEFIKTLKEYREWGYKIVSIFSDSESLKQKFSETVILAPREYLGILHELMEVDMIDEVIYFKKKAVASEIRETLRSCEELGVTFRMKNGDSKMNLTNAIKSEIAEVNFLTFTNIPHNPYALAVKNLIDINLSVLMIVLLSPFFILLPVIIKVTSPGPAIFRQRRIGLRGRPFMMYKFRTMYADAEERRRDLEEFNEADGPVFKISNDPRVTRLGRFLRQTGLDELPQLFNVLKGEMSLIGPRPPLPSETAGYKRWQLRRLSVKPGLSCFWQVKPNRHNMKFEKWMEKDLAYIDNWSLRLDFVILMRTIKTVFQKSGL